MLNFYYDNFFGLTYFFTEPITINLAYLPINYSVEEVLKLYNERCIIFSDSLLDSIDIKNVYGITSNV